LVDFLEVLESGVEMEVLPLFSALWDFGVIVLESGLLEYL
jgi:hypothetical protein